MEREVYLVGIGMGNPGTMTGDAAAAISRSDLVIGAARMVGACVHEGARTLALVRSDDIARALREEDYAVASVLFSGDVGFYSGAVPLAEKLDGDGGVNVTAIPGITSVSYLCARVLVPWHDAHLVSAHGRECDPVAEVRGHAKTFLLTGGAMKAQDVCASLAQAGLGEVVVYVGERLSYEDEAITKGTARELAQRAFDDLSAMLVMNSAVAPREPGRPVY